MIMKDHAERWDSLWRFKSSKITHILKDSPLSCVEAGICSIGACIYKPDSSRQRSCVCGHIHHMNICLSPRIQTYLELMNSRGCLYQSKIYF